MRLNPRLRALLLLLILGSWSQLAGAQTPSPLQEWQYSGGIILARLFDPDLPEFRRIVGVAAEAQPAYDGSRAYRIEGGPNVNIYYRDAAYISTGDGIGYNFLRGSHYQVGVALSYDMGRTMSQDYANLHGMGNIGVAPVGKLYATWVISKKLPLILRVDARQFMGGAQGAVGDIAIYTPLPGSSRTFVMFAGPSITVATRHYMQVLYGVTPQQSAASGHPVYDIDHNGTVAAGIGFSATKFLTPHWLLNVDAAFSQMRGSPKRSPIIEETNQRVLALSMDYNW
ncbi:MAG TPA: MipA/OmpV family protein [Steroidobacteraceae bacterium]|jgi:outer membrane scaffolding protein for murein synthesis (MipA/OmpV family)